MSLGWGIFFNYSVVLKRVGELLAKESYETTTNQFSEAFIIPEVTIKNGTFGWG